jgi:Sulfatase
MPQQTNLVVFASDNGLEGTHPWEGDSGPWRGTYFTAMEASLRAPFIIRWPGKVPAGRVSNEMVHIVDMYSTLAPGFAIRTLPDWCIADAWLDARCLETALHLEPIANRSARSQCHILNPRVRQSVEYME